MIRRWVVQPDEDVTIKSGTVKAKKLGVETTITATLEPPPPKPPADPTKPEPVKPPPPLLVNFLWFVDGIGPVQVLNSYGQMFVLAGAAAPAR